MIRMGDVALLITAWSSGKALKIMGKDGEWQDITPDNLKAEGPDGKWVSLREAIRTFSGDGDEYHTLEELYLYRMLYNAAFANALHENGNVDGRVVKSMWHSDGERCFDGGWFIVSMDLPTGQVSNHYELRDWDLFRVPEVSRAPEWDGHTPAIAAERLRRYCMGS